MENINELLSERLGRETDTMFHGRLRPHHNRKIFYGLYMRLCDALNSDAL